MGSESKVKNVGARMENPRGAFLANYHVYAKFWSKIDLS